MRLSKIKLAGFKSFVDPTTVPFPSNLVGVVGPNGCGKSNVIDAIRWVMGESSASRLRGDSIVDVIFNGSSSRKPVGAASVELLFDNSETTLEGQYAKYAEIALRREVSRDGISAYYLNGTRCRRKDITGIFLGTGLGPRSYSIIEQGMISRLIEAKPEEMRVFIEEAAGISKYKERRRETSHRIRHTKENLDRLLDVLEEVEKQIKHLDRQAKTAARYERYKDEERRTAAELLALRLKTLDERAEQSKLLLAEKEKTLEAIVAEQRKVEAKIEQARVSQSERTDEFNDVQARYYKSGSEIARLEQTIDHAEDLRERQEKDLEQAIQGAKEIADHINKDQSEIKQIELTLSELVPGLKEAKEAQQRSAESLRRAEQALTEWQEEWDACTAAISEAQQTRNVEETRSDQLMSQLRSLDDRNRKLKDASTETSPGELQAQYQELSVDEQRKRLAREDLDRHLADVQEKVQKLREQGVKLDKLVEDRQAALQKQQARLASLEAIQQAALGQGNESVQEWLAATGMQDNARVAQSIAVDEGWQLAVETVLGDYLQAVCVADVASATADLARLRDGKATLLVEHATVGSDTAGSETLAARVRRAPPAVFNMLRTVRIAESLEAAIAMRERLGDQGSVITKDGIWLSLDWLRVARDTDHQSGVLARERDIRQLKSEIRELKARFSSARTLAKDGRLRLHQLEQKRETLQRDATVLLNEYSDIKASLDSARFQLEQANARQAAISEESSDIEQQKSSAEKQARSSRVQCEQAIARLTELDAQREALLSRRAELRSELERVRLRADQDRQTAQDIEIQFESRRSSKESATQSLARMESQLNHFGKRQGEIREQLESSKEPLAKNKLDLEARLALRIRIEDELAQARRRVEDVESHIRDLDQKRMELEREVEANRATVSEATLAVQEIKVRHEGIAEQFAATNFDLSVLLNEMNEDATSEGWEEKLERIQRRIDRLGPINLAAIDEFKEQSARKEYLDSQLADLNDALATLEGAIRKIDKETRTRFRETFNNVDAGLKRLFPKLFGGGQAYLELTGDDLLSAGVTVMARPPGKRNSTIHLLSGGEKALTAVALVFAIFELNPAPFCLLDEVDAPLDDANVARYCEIVKEMADRVQFVFITHNKVTMEMARQLTGVTMQEPGVSRLVAVDLDEAVKMAAS